MRRKILPTSPSGPRPEVRAIALAKSEALKAELRRLVRAHPLSEREITRRLGYSPAYLTNLLSPSKGREPSPLRMDTYLALLEVLELDAPELLRRVLMEHAEETLARAQGASSLDLALARFEEELRSRCEGPVAFSAGEGQALIDSTLGLLRAVVAGAAEGGRSLR